MTDHSIIKGKFQDAHAQSSSVREHPVITIDLHDILNNEENSPVKLKTLEHLIEAQASLHHCQYVGETEDLKQILENNGNTLRGFVLYAEGKGPAGFAIYYPMINDQGQRITFCEDFLITESCRGQGMINLLFHELAKRTLKEGSEYLQWSTDRRNFPVLNVNYKVGALHPNIRSLSLNDLLANDLPSENSLSDAWTNTNLETVLLERKYIDQPEKLGVSSAIIRETGDLDFQGFITFDKSTKQPVAITAGAHHYSTFKLEKGIYLENPVMAQGYDQEQIALSVAKATKSYCNDNGLDHATWNVKTENTALINFLHQEFQCPIHSMNSTPESELVMYKLHNGALQKMAETEPNKTIRIDINAPIGATNRQNNAGPVNLPPIFSA